MNDSSMERSSRNQLIIMQSFPPISYRLLSFVHVSCLASHVKPRNGDAIAPFYWGEDVRRET